MGIDVFVSYHTETAQDAADAVVTALEQQGLCCWYASRDAEGRFAGNIRRAILDSSVFVVLLNHAACKSKHVRNEVALAFDQDDLVIIPLRITNEPLSDDMDYYLHSFNHINAVGGSRSNGIRELTRRVLKTLGRAAVSNIETINYSDGCVYTGQVVNGKRHGKGKLLLPDGDVYEGDWKDGQRTGKGKYTWRNGNVYEGDWKNGQRTGKGKKVWSNGDVYEGDWKNSQRTGKGKSTWRNGNVYEGDWKNDQLTGKGKYTWPEGTVYVGDFVDGVITGYGTYTYANGEVKSGRWENGKYLGK